MDADLGFLKSHPIPERVPNGVLVPYKPVIRRCFDSF